MDEVTGRGRGSTHLGSPPRQRVLILGGAGRSGSTVLERIIGRLPSVAPLGEARYLWDRGVLEDQRCGCGEAFSDCEFWAGVGADAFGGWSQQQAEKMVRWREANDRARRIPALVGARRNEARVSGAQWYAQTYARVYQSAGRISGASWVIDSSKHVSMPYAVSLAEALDVRVLHVVRDPRGVAYSWQKSVVRPEITEHVELMPQYSSREVALSWVIHNAGLAALPRLGVPLMRVRYEDLVDDPLTSVERIAGFMGLTVPAALAGDLARGQVELGPSHTVAGNPMRFRLGEVRLARDSEWETELPVGDRRLLTGLTGPLLLRYRYPLSLSVSRRGR